MADFPRYEYDGQYGYPPAQNPDITGNQGVYSFPYAIPGQHGGFPGFPGTPLNQQAQFPPGGSHGFSAPPPPAQFAQIWSNFQNSQQAQQAQQAPAEPPLPPGFPPAFAAPNLYASYNHIAQPSQHPYEMHQPPPSIPIDPPNPFPFPTSNYNRGLQSLVPTEAALPIGVTNSQLHQQQQEDDEEKGEEDGEYHQPAGVVLPTPQTDKDKLSDSSLGSTLNMPSGMAQSSWQGNNNRSVNYDSQARSVNAPNNHPTPPTPIDSTAFPSNQLNMQTADNTRDRNTLHKRALAAVQKFHQHGLGFEVLAHELESDDKGLLRELFQDAYVPILEQPMRDHVNDTSKNNQEQQLPIPSRSPYLSHRSQVEPTASLSSATGDPNLIAPNPSLDLQSQGQASNGRDGKFQPSDSTAKPVRQLPQSQPFSKPSTQNGRGLTPVQRPAMQPSNGNGQQPNSNREAYLARLAAARSKKAAGGSEVLNKTTHTPASPTSSKEVSKNSIPAEEAKTDLDSSIKAIVVAKEETKIATDQAPQEPKSPAASESPAPVAKTNTPVIKPGLTELVRQRLEALKKSSASSTKAAPLSENPPTKERPTPVRVSSPSSIEYSSARGSSTPEQVTSKHPPAASSKPSSTAAAKMPAETIPTTPSTSIPGLFMAAPLSSSQGAPTVMQPADENTELKDQVKAKRQTSPAPNPALLAAANLPALSSSGRKRPLSADFMESGPVSRKRIFSGGTQEEETCVIDLTDDESDENSDEEGEVQENPVREPSFAPPPRPVLQHNSSSSIIPGLGGTTRPALPGRMYSMPSAGMRSPAPAASPDQIARNEQIRRKEETIALEKKKLQEKIAQMELRKKNKLLNAGSGRPSASSSRQATPPVGPSAVSEMLPAVTSSVDITTPPVVANETAMHVNLPTTVNPIMPSPNVAAELNKKRQAELDAVVATNQAKIRELMLEMQRLEEENRKKTEDRLQLAKELESVGIDTQGMSHADLQATKDEMVVQEAVASNGDSAMVDFIVAPCSNGTLEESSRTHSLPEGSLMSPPTPSKQDEPALEQRDPPQAAGLESQSQEQDMDDIYEEDDIDEHQEEGEVSDTSVFVDHTTQAFDVDEEADMSLSSTTSGSSSSDEDGGDEVDGEEEEEEAEFEPSLEGSNPLRHQELGISEETEEAEYDPEEVVTPPEMTNKAEDSGQDMEIDEDDYQPEPTGSDGSAVEGLEEPMTEMIADDLAPELHISNNGGGAAGAAAATVSSLPQAKPLTFTPYESPLKSFKSYRYHPQYREEVSNGFASITYSHKIDDKKAFCQFETAGGFCNDPQCNNQHFRDIELSDDKMLVQLGMDCPGHTDEEKARWNNGLKAVIKSLRTQNIQGSEEVAAKIVEFRRAFIGDPTKILNLDSF